MAIDLNRIQSLIGEVTDEEEALLRELLPYAMGHRLLSYVVDEGAQATLAPEDEASQSTGYVIINVPRNVK